MNPQNMCRARLIPIHPVQHALDKSLFEFADGLIEQNAPFHHLAD